MLLQDVQEAAHSASRVDDVLHHQHVAAPEVTQVVPADDADLTRGVFVLGEDVREAAVSWEVCDRLLRC